MSTRAIRLSMLLEVSKITLAVSLTMTLFPLDFTTNSLHLFKGVSLSADGVVNLKQGTEISARETVEKKQ